jgi:hypothetical protein
VYPKRNSLLKHRGESRLVGDTVVLEFFVSRVEAVTLLGSRSARADDAAGDFHDRFLNEGDAFESNAQAPEVIRRGDYAFDDLSGFARAVVARLAPTGVWIPG